MIGHNTLKKELRKHLRDNNIFFCQFCDKMFDSENVLSVHDEIVHENLDFQNVSNNKSKAESELNTLKKTHVHRNKKDSLCEICHIKCCNRNDLTIHLNAVHKQIKAYACKVCCQKFSRQSSLNTHITTVHHKLRPFKCEICNQ